MKPARCPRLFEVEALRDGRLVGAERASFERHMAGCVACSREAEELAALAQALREGEPAAPDELRVRRERTRLLAAFDRVLVTRTDPRASRRRLLGWVGVAALSAGLLFFFSSPRPESEPLPSANTLIRAGADAVWSRRAQGQRDQIHLERGALWIHVTPAARELPLLVVLPDGELEDTGTTFSVRVEAGRTTRVDVEEGSVLLRLRGQPPLAIAAGEAWAAAPPAPSSAKREAEPPTAAELSPAAKVSPAAERARQPGPERSSKERPPRAPPPRAPSHEAADDFRAAVAALDRGQNHEAASRFTRFLERHRRDARAEDAAYLRILALQRHGDAPAMKSAAREYLRRHPAGFRRNEVEALAR